MADLRTLTLALVADIDKFKKGLDKADNETKGFSSKLKSALKTGALAFGALGAAAGTFAAKIGKDAVLAAADFNEEISKSEVLFGDTAKVVQNFAKNASKALLLNRGEALKAASNFAIFGKAAGLSGKELADFSTDFVELAADLASFNNTTPEQAILAIGSALRGESEPIRNYGVLINEASLKQIALRDGIIKTTKEALTPEQKVLATTALLYEQTRDAQGDIERTRDSFTNTLKGFKQAWADIRIEIGENLLPIFQPLVAKIQDLLPTFRTFITTLFGGQNSLDKSSYFAYKAQENLGEKMDENEWAGFNLAISIRNLAGAFRDLFKNIDEGTGEGSGFAQFITDVADIINTIADLIRAIDTGIGKIIDFNNALSRLPLGLGGFGESQQVVSKASSALKAKQARDEAKYQPIPLTFNINGAIDPQGTARTVTKVLSQQKRITGVNFSGLGFV